MSKIIRAVRLSGPVVTVGQIERDIYLDEGEKETEAGSVDLAELLQERLEQLQSQWDQAWQRRLEEELDNLKKEASTQLEEAEEQWRVQLEQVTQQRYEEGCKAGVESKETEAREAVERLAELHRGLEEERAKILNNSEELVVDLGVALARRIIGVQAEMDRKILARTMRRALDRLSHESHLQFKVHPDDLQIARKFAAKWVERASCEMVLKVKGSHEVDRGRVYGGG